MHLQSAVLFKAHLSCQHIAVYLSELSDSVTGFCMMQA